MTNIVYIAASLDGFIADRAGKIDWLCTMPNPDKLDFGYAAFIERVDAIISRWREMICRYVASIFIFSLLQRTNCLKLNPNIAANPDASIV